MSETQIYTKNPGIVCVKNPGTDSRKEPNENKRLLITVYLKQDIITFHQVFVMKK
eukprot:TRINITY_DN7022_c0_g1_i1.p1 TRINITY_DN7022_c0_g1~~TRINITY_DN7022_c0_g1_i1.p1  ORF type:complete len:55 (-),score=1.64 TRINITY_DN7022_c0_g1_i1:236-400(-)